MAQYPGAVAIPRVVENDEGVVYDVNATKVVFAEDINNLAAEVVAIQNALGKNLENIKNMFMPVGTIYGNGQSTTNPATLLGFGTWQPYSQGRVVAGKATSGTFATIGATTGEEKHTLTEAELPHIDGSFAMHGQESGTYFYRKYGHATGGEYGKYKSPGGSTSGVVSVTNPGFAFGSGQSHNNVQPTVVAALWIRTA